MRERGQMRSKKELAALHTYTTAMVACRCSRMSLCGLWLVGRMGVYIAWCRDYLIIICC